MRPCYVNFTTGGKRLWVEWFNAHAAEMDDPEIPAPLAGAWSKLRSYAARLAMILSRLRSACNPDAPDWPEPIDVEDVRGAVALVDSFKSHTRRVHHEMTGGVGNRHAMAILDWIRRHRPTMFRESDVTEHLRHYRGHPADLAEGLKLLEKAGAIRPRREPANPGEHGPKFKGHTYDVHPELLGAPENSAHSANFPPESGPDPNSGTGGIVWRPQESREAEREVFEL